VANSLAQGGLPPCSLDEIIAFQALTNPKVDILNLREEKDLTQKEQQILDKIKIDIASQQDVILEHGYTGPIETAHIYDIVRSVAVSLIYKRILYLQEFKEGASMYGHCYKSTKGLQAFLCQRASSECGCQLFVQSH